MESGSSRSSRRARARSRTCSRPRRNSASGGTKIEEFEGELRYYANLASLSTLTITSTEKEIRAAAGLTENERVQAGVEVEDVDKAYQQVLAAVVEAKGRSRRSPS